MKKPWVVGGVVVLCLAAAGSAQAMNATMGGYIYRNSVRASNWQNGQIYDVQVMRTTLNDDWTFANPKEMTDNIVDTNTSSFYFNNGLYNNLEILNPRHEGGDGD